MSDVTVVGSVGYTVVPDVPPNFAAQLTDALKPALDSAATDLTGAFQQGSKGAGDALDGLAKDAGVKGKEAGDNIKDGVGAGVLSLKDIVIGSAIGDLLADSIKAGVSAGIDAMKDLISFLPDLGSEIQGQFNMIRSSTGETGQVLDGLKESFNNIAKNTPADLGDVGKAVSILNQRLDDTGPALEATSLNALRLSRITGTDLAANLKGVTGAFVGFNIKADDQAGKLDELFRIYQRTGISVTELSSALGTVGQTAQLSGVSFEETASLIGLLDKAGLSAGQAQQAFTKILKDSVKEGKDAKVGFRETFAAIANGTMSLDDGFKLFGPRAAAVFGAIRSGKLDFAGLSKEIMAGGDTLKGVAAETSTWTGQLGVLANEMKIALEPIALAVFGAITTAVKAVRPVLESVMNYVVGVATPIFQGFVLAVQPVWQFFDKIRVSAANMILALRVGFDVFDSIGLFFATLSGNGDVGNAVSDTLRKVAQALTDVWTALQPVRDAVSEAFTTIKEAVASFFEDHPDAALAGLAATITAIVVPALFALGGVLSGLVVTVASFVGGIVAVPLAIGAAVAAVIYAYENFQTFHDVVDSVVQFFKDHWQPILMASTGVLGLIVTHLDTIIPALQNFAQVARETFTQFGEWISKNVLPFLQQLGDIVQKVFVQTIQPAFSRLWETLQKDGMPIIQWLIDHWQTVALVIGGLLTGGIVPLIAGAVALYEKFGFVRDVVGAVISFFGDFAKIITNLLSESIGPLLDGIGAFVTLLDGILHFDWDKIKEGLSGIAQAVLDNIGNILSSIGDLFMSIVSNFGPLLVTALQAAWQFVVDNGPTILATLWDWIQQIPGLILSLLGSLGSLLVQGLVAAFDFVVAHGLDILSNLLSWAIKIPVLLVAGLIKLGMLLVDALKAAFGWIVEHGPDILADVFHWLTELPGRFIGLLGNVGQTLVDWLTAGFSYLVEHGPDIIKGFISFMADLPGKMFSAITGALGAVGGFVMDVGKNIFNAVTGFMNDHLIKPLRDFKVEIPFFGDFHPFDFLPIIQKLAMGGVFDKPTLAMIGEAGREAVIPLDRPNRAREVLREAGLDRGGQGGGIVYNIVVTPTYDASMTRDRAAEYGNIEGDAIAQRLAVTAIIRAS